MENPLLIEEENEEENQEDFILPPREEQQEPLQLQLADKYLAEKYLKEQQQEEQQEEQQEQQDKEEKAYSPIKINRYSSCQEIIHQPENLLRIIDIFFETNSDDSLRDLVSFATEFDLPYPTGFTRIMAINILKKLPINKQLKIALIILDVWKQPAGFVFPLCVPRLVDLSFLLNEQEQIVGFISFKEEEKELDGVASIGLYGKGRQRIEAARVIVKFWEDYYAKYLYDNKINFVYSLAFSSKNATILKHITKQEKRNGSPAGFFSTGISGKQRVDGKIMNITRYEFDLHKKFNHLKESKKEGKKEGKVEK